MAIETRLAKPDGYFIKADGRFITAVKDLRPEASEWPDLQIWATDGQFRRIPYKEFISSNGRFIKDGQAQWPFYEANGRFIKANGHFIKANRRFIKPRRALEVPLQSLGPRDKGITYYNSAQRGERAHEGALSSGSFCQAKLPSACCPAGARPAGRAPGARFKFRV